MGSVITLRIGNLEVDWGKNGLSTDHGPLFKLEDETMVEYDYINEFGEHLKETKEASSRPLRGMVGRLALLGYTLSAANREYSELLRRNGLSPDDPSISFERFLDAVKTMDVSNPSFTYESEYDFGELGRQMTNG